MYAPWRRNVCTSCMAVERARLELLSVLHNSVRLCENGGLEKWGRQLIRLHELDPHIHVARLPASNAPGKRGYKIQLFVHVPHYIVSSQAAVRFINPTAEIH